MPNIKALCLLVAGSSGFRIVGPFKSETDANTYADKNVSVDSEWLICHMDTTDVPLESWGDDKVETLTTRTGTAV